MTMKIFLFLIAALFSLTAKSQTSVYHPFPDSNAVWNIDYLIYNVSIICGGHPDDFQYSYEMTGDTIIGSNTYHKFFTPYVDPIDTCGGIHSFGSTGYKGCFRQNITAKNIFYIPPWNNVEYLLYDFNLQIGDSIRGFLVNGCSPVQIPVVIGIDSILIGSNYRTRWQLSTLSSIIEGIGAIDGPLEGLCDQISNLAPNLMCYSQNNTILYSSPPFWSAQTCNLITSVTNNASKYILPTIFPNPFHTTAAFKVDPTFENSELNIYNLLGGQVKHQRINNQSTIINRDELTDGIYFLQLINDQGHILIEKFVVE